MFAPISFPSISEQYCTLLFCIVCYPYLVRYALKCLMLLHLFLSLIVRLL